MLRHGLGILGYAAAFAAGYVLAYDWSSGTTEICQSSPEWASWIFINTTLASYDSFWVSHSGPGTPQGRQISHRCTCTPVHSALYILDCFIIIMFCSTLNQWTQCTQMYQDTSPLDAGSSSHFASANIWIYASLVCEGRQWNAVNCQLRVNCPLEEGCLCTTKP